ncbi:T9SS type A sorting domain-containing protein [Winogradskyella sp.]|nr:T9SS type A sorting domain-containing protein [Winogradskyella sp.]MDB4752674.1 T9SS type A sorting domain-containing protein [Winogradskyella sp.]
MKNKLLLLVLCVSAFSFGQIIPEDVKPPSWKQPNEFTSSSKPFKLQSFDLKSIQDEDLINDKDKSKPWRFGHDVYVDHNFNDVGQWTTLPNGDKIWRMSYKSEEARTLNFMFDVFWIPEGAKLYVYNNDKDDLLRPFTHHNNTPEEILGTWMVKGDQAWIEYHQPANVSGVARITVGSVIHGYRTAESYQKALGDSGNCNQDVDCDITPPGADPYNLNTVKENIKKASAMITVGGGTGLCSGTLINNVNNDGTPYFMTANHCGFSSGWAFRFNWRSPNPSCSTTASSPNGSFDQTVSGAVQRANSAQSDMSLVEITDTSFFNNNPDVVWVGWNNSTTQTPNVNFGIHHPRGDIQKVCREDDGAYRADVNFEVPNTKMWYIDEWELGVTEPGSSGSGLFNENGELIGVLSGGTAACSGTVNNGAPDYYGRFGVAWDFGNSASSRLRDWLDPANTGATTLGQFPALETFDNDARASAGDGNESFLCDMDFMPDVTIENPGNLNLMSATVSYYLDAEPSTIVNWTGNLANAASEVVASPIYNNLAPGSHTFTIMVSNPNGVTDENTSNDSFVFNFEVSPEYSTSEVVFNLETDFFGSETSWQLTNSTGSIVASGPSTPYSNTTIYQETITIPALDQCYTFTILDSEGDGICCGFFGDGSYNLEDENGNVIISGGEFGASESALFKALDPLSIGDNTLGDFVSIYPNPVKDELNIRTQNINEALDYEIVNALGQSVKLGKLTINTLNRISLSELSTGIYFIKLSTATSSFVQKIIKE